MTVTKMKAEENPHGWEEPDTSIPKMREWDILDRSPGAH